MAGVVHLPWYATGFRGDALAEELADIAAVSLRYGATAYDVYRYRDDRYKFLQTAHFEDKMAWERYWEGPEFTDFRIRCSGWYQIPVVYAWTDLVATGAIAAEPGRMPVAGRGGNGDPTG
jgi:quinol monooxygenase YgiN